MQSGPQPKVYMTPEEIRETQGEIDALCRMLKADQSSRSPKIQDISGFRADIAKKQKLIEDFAPKKVTGKQASKLYARAKELEVKLKDVLLPSKDYFQSYPKGGGSSHDFERAVRRQMQIQTDKQLKNEVLEYKSIMRRLDPDDVGLSNIERFRR